MVFLAGLAEKQSHEGVGPGVRQGAELFAGHVGEPQRFIEVDGCGQSCAAAEENTVGADPARFADGRDHDLATDSMVPKFWLDGHFPELEHAGMAGDKSDAADDPAVDSGEKHAAAAIDDFGLRVIEDAAVFLFQCEEAGDPLLVQCLEGLGILGTVQGCNDE